MKKIFNEFGVKYYENYLDQNTSFQIYDSFDVLEFTKIRQEKFGHYGHVFSVDQKTYPSKDESYAAEFNVCIDPRKNTIFDDFFMNFIKNIKTDFPSMNYYIYPQVNKITTHTFWRSHVDTYAGDVGFTFFFTRNWKWDYGGILSFIKDDKAFQIFPNNGTLLLRNEVQKPPHYVSLVPPYVNKHYYLAVGWLSTVDKGSSDIRGDYIKIE